MLLDVAQIFIEIALTRTAQNSHRKPYFELWSGHRERIRQGRYFDNQPAPSYAGAIQ